MDDNFISGAYGGTPYRDRPHTPIEKRWSETMNEIWRCMECWRKLPTLRAAEKASSVGCPKCGGGDIDLVDADEKRPEAHS